MKKKNKKSKSKQDDKKKTNFDITQNDKSIFLKLKHHERQHTSK